MRSGVCALVVVLAAVVAPAALADGSGATTTAETTTAQTTTAATTTSAAPAAAAIVPTRLPSRCPSAGAVTIVEPRGAPLVLGAAPASLGASAYPGDARVVSFASADEGGRSCRPGSVSIRSLSLFGGAVTADSVTATRGAGSVSGLRVEGAPVSLGPGESAAVGGWGLLVTDEQVGKTLRAPLAVRLLEARGSLPAGSVVLVGYGATPPPAAPASKPKTATATTTPAATTARAPAAKPAAKKRHRKHHRKKKHHLPLKATPALGLPRYAFPVAGGAEYTDTYGGQRSDIQDGWHHGDDLFAPLGAPVVAVADGTLSLVGWNGLGGWRIWLEDSRGNEFYYAHLAAYSRWILHHPHVRAGQVIGFLGRTGDAFTTQPHLHFEIHPSGLFRLGYDGAVDPTSYLHAWQVVRVEQRKLPQPARLRAPKGAPRVEAAVVWRQLLAARGHAPAPGPVAAAVHPGPPGTGSPPPPRRLAGVFRASAAVAAPPDTSLDLWVFVALGLAAAGGAGTLLARRLGRREEPAATREA